MTQARHSLSDQVFFVLCCIACFVVLVPLLVPIGAGAVLGYVSERPVDWMARKLKVKGDKGRLALSAGFVTVVLAAFLLPIGAAIYSASKDVVALVGDQLNDQRNGEGIGATATRLLGWVENHAIAWGLPVSHEEFAQLLPRLRAGALALAGVVGRSITGMVQGTPAALFKGGMVLVVWGWMAAEGHALRERILPRLLPFPKQRNILTKVTGEVLHGLLIANVLVSAVQAVLCTTALALFRVPRFFIWGVLTFFLSFVPVVGTTIVTLGAAGYLFSVGRIGAGIGMLVIAVVVGSIDNVLRPLFMQGSVELGFFAIFLALVGGLAMFGVAGSVLGPLAFSLCIAALRALEQADDTAQALPRA